MERRDLHRLAVPLAVVGGIVALAAAAPLLPLADPVHIEVSARLTPPSEGHWLGQDEYGRDVLSRAIWGARASLAVSFLAAAIAGIAGTALGLLGGYFRGVVEILTVRSAEAVLCFPPLLLALLVVTLLGPGAGTLIVALSILYAPSYARVAYAETLAARNLDYVVAQEALGARSGRILLRTVLPNVAPPLLVQFSLTVASAMVLESGLSFLGLGVVPPEPSWGLMIRGARSTMDQAPWLLLWPCLALTGTIVALNMLCDALRDVLDPRGRTVSANPFRAFVSGLLPATEPAPAPPALLRVDGLHLAIGHGPGALPAVRDVSLAVAPGETLAVVGESGSGKTLTGLAILGLLPPVVRVTGGRILYTGRDGTTVDLARLGEPALRRLRGDELSMVFQDPSASLNPVHRVGDQVAETIRAHRDLSAAEARRRAVALLDRVGLPDAARRARAYPHELSGGQRQRAVIAAAIANGPRLLIADEPTTALDVTIQAQILELMAGLKAQAGGMGLIFVTHNLAVVSEIADRVVVMYVGEVVEEGPVAEVFGSPRHPYTAALVASVPEGDDDRLSAIPGVVPPLHDLPAGCRFAPRCGLAEPACTAGAPALESLGGGRSTRCRRWREVA
ncbi:peptide ABC transporter permease [Thalassobaculum fulvum]|uniref:Peptide ABC transporter permease n=1 Tax=Thalassobaculum fulvum TaxID=1633335 RepID=A0A919CTE2_9PROT|nr:dipeptide/oligopeptide/nickel ABC transporter permease/ATP-binding protein [Thalassobaculum fulvum]GHD61196.1 peptide ABC transporter permease [Thalassobaculum fulvum]